MLHFEMKAFLVPLSGSYCHFHGQMAFTCWQSPGGSVLSQPGSLQGALTGGGVEHHVQMSSAFHPLPLLAVSTLTFQIISAKFSSEAPCPS